MPLQPPQQYTARVEDITIFNDKYVRFFFEVEQPHTLTFAAGQYVSIKVAEDGTRRSYSICSRPDISHGFELLIDLTPQGPGTVYLKNLKVGDTISFLAPLGRFVLSDQPAAAISFVATGSGIAPFRSMILDLLQLQGDARPITLYWGLRYVEQMFWQDEFSELSEAFPNFSFHPVISKPVPEWPLCRGRVTDCLSVHAQAPQTAYYLCGNAGMITDTLQLLANQGVPAEYVHHEKFF
jgi:CDP-4-dehydro-6-deoxyglucose reductase, E3